jgi:hypothetical protein
MAKWVERKRLKMKKHNRWQAAPGNKIFVANSGAVRFDYPGTWIVEPGDKGSICFYDRQPPTHHAILQMSVWELLGPGMLTPGVPAAVDWTGLPLLELFVHSTSNIADNRELRSEKRIQELMRPGLEGIWQERLMFDFEDKKEVVSRTLMARGANVTTLLSYDFYADEQARFHPIWEDVVGSLVLGRYIKDPTTGV